MQICHFANQNVPTPVVVVVIASAPLWYHQWTANDIFNQKISHSVPGFGLGRGLGRGLTRGLGLGLFVRPLPLKRKTYHAEVIY